MNAYRLHCISYLVILNLLFGTQMTRAAVLHNPVLSGGQVLILKEPATLSPPVTINVEWPEGPTPTTGTLTLTIENGSDKIDILDSSGSVMTTTSWTSNYPTSFQVRAKAVSSSVNDIQLKIQHDSGPVRTHQLTVITVELKEVSFSADQNNYIQLKSDDLNTDYAPPHWVDNSNPLNGNADDPGDVKFPFAYVRNTKPKIAAKFKVTPSGLTNPFNVEATGPTGFKVNAGTAASISGDFLYLSPHVSDELLPNTIKFHEAGTIQWTVAVDGGASVAVGYSTHRIYVVWAAPTTTLRQETVFYIGSKRADGISVNTAAIADAINSEFTSRAVYRVNTPAAMTYWGGITPAQDVVTLLEVGDGSCLAWAELWCAVAGAQGIDSNVVEITPQNGEYGFLVKNWSFGASPAAGGGTADYPYLVGASGTGTWEITGIAAQGNPDPTSAFANHFIVAFGVALYDPSYGAPKILGSNREKTYEDGAFHGFMKEEYDWFFFNRRVCARQNDVSSTSAAEVDFN